MVDGIRAAAMETPGALAEPGEMNPAEVVPDVQAGVGLGTDGRRKNEAIANTSISEGREKENRTGASRSVF